MNWRGWLTDLRLGIATERAARRAAVAVNVGEDVIQARVLARYHLFVPRRDRSVGPALLCNGRFDPWTGRLLTRYIRAGMTVADVGANLGYFTMLMADRVGTRGQVLAFEPGAEHCRLIRRSLAANRYENRVTLHGTGLGAEDGRAMNFVTPGDYLAGSSIWEADRAHPSARPITIRRFDHIPGAGDVALAKIDAEGSEPAIWAGMAGLLAGGALRTVLMEFTAGHYADPPGFVAAIRAAGFDIRIIDRRRGPIPIADKTLGGFPAHHIVNLLLER